TLWPMIHSGRARDLIVVQLAPNHALEVPKDAAGIRRRLGEIVFNSSLVAEMQAIMALRAVATRTEASSPVLDLRLHRIGPPRHDLLQQGSSLERSRAWIERLQREGSAAGRRFLSRHGRDVGMRETLDISRVFADANKPKMRVPANEEMVEMSAGPTPLRRSAAVG